VNYFVLSKIQPYKYGHTNMAAKLLLPIHSPDLTYCNCRDDMMLDAVERSKTNRDCRFSVTSKNRIS